MKNILCYQILIKNASGAKLLYLITTANILLSLLNICNANFVTTNESSIAETLPAVEEKLSIYLPPKVLENLKVNPIHIVLDSTLVTDGFFDNETPNKIYLHPKLLTNPGFMEVALHELFHAIHYRYNPQEENWAKEGLAQMFSYYTTKHFSGYGVEAAFRKPDAPLFTEYNHLNYDAAWYGKTLLFAKYFLAHCSEASELGLFFTWAGFYKKPNSYGLYWINSILKETADPANPAYCQNSKNLFTYFSLALAVNKSSGIKGNPYHIFSTSLKTSTKTSAEELKAWNFQILQINETNLEKRKQIFKDALKIWQIENNKVSIFELNTEFPYQPTAILTPHKYIPENTVIAIRTQ